VQARHVRDKITTHVGGIIGPAGIHRVVLPGPLDPAHVDLRAD
jgi:hypothetical protein